eukprot:NODE_1383_length_941_cov_74.950673_g1066_i0.p1 GENE.NODE_1383_length_941_cov_74.950673_g1066_i0~~NODE_1383_length_941_cov_74.950673_g1066_i0.p1  ORF type:complete len:252 (-),score=28.32 NODE_1383_length_941_cov_74.950673_g1066_i0:93-848(-)
MSATEWKAYVAVACLPVAACVVQLTCVPAACQTRRRKLILLCLLTNCMSRAVGILFRLVIVTCAACDEIFSASVPIYNLALVATDLLVLSFWMKTMFQWDVDAVCVTFFAIFILVIGIVGLCTQGSYKVNPAFTVFPWVLLILGILNFAVAYRGLRWLRLCLVNHIEPSPRLRFNLLLTLLWAALYITRGTLMVTGEARRLYEHFIYRQLYELLFVQGPPFLLLMCFFHRPTCSPSTAPPLAAVSLLTSAL